jgi:hypothetical protein
MFQVTHECRLNFCISNQIVDELEFDVVPLDVCEVIFMSPYLWDKYVIFLRRDNK